jgi:hypothetical protein
VNVFSKAFSLNRACSFSVCITTKLEMVDWATQDRLYPPGYQTVDIRYRRNSVDSSLPYSVSLNKSIRFSSYINYKDV